MSKKYAIHKFDFMYNDEWYDADHHHATLYAIVDDEQTAEQHWAALERDSLNNEYYLGNLSTFCNGELSTEQYKDIIAFIKNDCGLPLSVDDSSFFDAEDVPINDMSDKQLLTFLQLAQSNHYILKEYVASAPRYVIYTAEQGYMPQDPSGYSDSIWFTHDAHDVIAQYRADAHIYAGEAFYENETQLTVADLQSPIVQSLISQYQADIRIDYNADKTEGDISFAKSPAEVVTAFNAVLERPTYVVQQIDDVTFTTISQYPSQLIR